MERDLVARLSELEGRHRRLRMLLLVNTTLLLSGLASFLASCASSQARPSAPGALRVSQLEVVDARGVVRVWIGSDLPDAVIAGKPRPRGQEASGVLLYDDTGQERGGYVTFSPGGQIGLTLDTRHGQVALFAADPDAGVALKLWQGDDGIELRADPDGARITSTDEKRVVFQEPPVQAPEKTALCSELRGAKAKYSDDQLMGFCLEHLPEEGCRRCLSAPM